MKTLRDLLKLVGAFWKWALLSVFLGWATVVSWVALISTSSYLISYAALQPSVAELQVAIVGVRFFGIARAVFRYLERLVSHNTTFKILTEMRVKFFEGLEKITPAGIVDFSSGDILARIVDDIETLQDFYIRVLYPPVVALFSSVAVLWFFGRWSLEVVLLILGFQLIVGVVLPLAIMLWSKKPARELVQNGAEIRNVSVDAIRGINEVVAFGLQGDFQDRMKVLGKRRFSLQRKMHLISGVQEGLTSLFVNMSVIGVLFFAIPLVNSDVIDGKLLAVLVLGGLASFEAVMQLPAAMQNFSASLQAGRRLADILDHSANIRTGDLQIDEEDDFSIQIKHLDFAYPGDRTKVLDAISLELPKGKKVGIVGISGVGKTTLLNLLLRHWELTGGEILLNDKDIWMYDAHSVRDHIAVVNQKIYLFNSTIMENLRLGNPNASQGEVIQAAKAAGIHEFVTGLPDGYETILGEQGAFISGGEAQRLGLARALLKRASLYLLDEPFAHLDPISRAEILTATFRHLGDKSIVFVTHQIAGLSEMDEILLLDGGKVIERGNHQELIRARGFYAEMWQVDQELLLGQL